MNEIRELLNEIEHLEDALRAIQAATSDKAILAITDRALCDDLVQTRLADCDHTWSNPGRLRYPVFCTKCRTPKVISANSRQGWNYDADGDYVCPECDAVSTCEPHLHGVGCSVSAEQGLNK